MRHLRALLVVSLLAGSPALAEPLFKYKGKAFEAKDLTVPMQQTLFDLESESYMRREALAEQAMIEMYLDEEAKKAGKSRTDYEATVFKTTEPTEKEVSTWFEANKARIPPGYKLEQIAGDIKQLLKGEQKKKVHDELVAKLKADGTMAFVGTEPVAPIVKVDTLGYPMKGAKDAKVQIVEFADYQCPHCKEAVADLDAIVKKYDGKVSLVFMDFPINQSGISTMVSHGAYCAEQQGKYWEYNNLAFEKQRTLDKDSPKALAKDLKLDEKKFDECYASEAPKTRVAKAKAEGEKVGVGGTPTIFVNGRKVRGHASPEIAKEIEKALKGGQS